MNGIGFLTLYRHEFLHRSDSIGDGGYVVWHLAVSLLGTWIATYFLTFKGTSLLAKVHTCLSYCTNKCALHMEYFFCNHMYISI